MKSFGKGLSFFATVIALILTSTAPEARQPHHDAMVVFGDSLSDTGNLFLASQGQVPPSSTYFSGRFSNGRVGIEYLWDLIKPASATDNVKPSLPLLTMPTSGAVSFAFGGSGSGESDVLQPGNPPIPGLLGQLPLFAALPGGGDRSRALYVIFTGANDYYRGRSISYVVGNIVTGIQTLYDLGGRKMMVPNLPNLGLIPLITDSAQKEALLTLTLAHNAALAQALTGLRSTLPGLRLIEVDSFSFLERLTARSILVPALPMPGAACLFDPTVLCPTVSDFTAHTRYLFWDVQHPTTATHSAFGHYLHTQLLQ